MARKNIAPQPWVIDGYYDPQTGDLRIQLDKPLQREGTTNCAFVVDGSASMSGHYQHGIFGKASDVERFLHEAGAFVANYDSDKGVQVYLCCLGDGRGVQNLGSFPQAGLERLKIESPNLGSGTYLLPALLQVVNEVVVEARADYGFIVLPTDGEIHDFEAIKSWASEMSSQILVHQHAPFKVVLIGFDGANKAQMDELDNLPTSVDLFNALFVSDLKGAMNALDSEVVNNEFTVCPAGYLEVDGQAVLQFERGVPQRIDANVTAGLRVVTVVLKDGSDEQRIDVALPPFLRF